MNKRYIDFVPHDAKKGAKKPVVVDTPPQRFDGGMSGISFDDLKLDEIFEERKEVSTPKPREMPKYGVIEDLNPKFVKTEVDKRPLSNSKKPATGKTFDDVTAVKSKKVGNKLPFTGKRVVKKTAGAQKKEFKEAIKPGAVPPYMIKSPFVNTEKVVKRPLSKNVYTKEIVVSEEEAHAPVTIIAKPEKDSRVGFIIAIILTIILGATAGTVAFLLLPK